MNIVTSLETMLIKNEFIYRKSGSLQLSATNFNSFLSLGNLAPHWKTVENCFTKMRRFQKQNPRCVRVGSSQNAFLVETIDEDYVCDIQWRGIPKSDIYARILTQRWPSTHPFIACHVNAQSLYPFVVVFLYNIRLFVHLFPRHDLRRITVNSSCVKYECFHWKIHSFC